MDEAPKEAKSASIVPAWVVFGEAALLAVAWALIRKPVPQVNVSRDDARAAFIVLAVLPAFVWLIAARRRISTPSDRSPGSAWLGALIPAAIATGLSPVLQFAFLVPRPAPSPVAMLPLAVAAFVIGFAGHALFKRPTQTARRATSASAIYFLFGAEIIALAGGLLFTERPMVRFRWPDILSYGLRDAVRILVLLLVAVYLVRAHRSVRAFTLSARRRVLRMPPARFVLIAAVISIAFCTLFAGIVLHRMPHVQDEIAIHFQAKVFAMGRLYADPPPLPEFFDQEFLVCDTQQGKWYGKYQPGASAMMALGVPLGLEWLVNPLLAGVGIWLVFLLARRLVPGGIARLAVVLVVISPFWIMTYSSMMLHPGCLTILLAGTYVLIRASDSQRPAGWAVLGGLLLAGSLLFRPYTGVVVGGLVGVLVLIARPRAFIRPTLFAPLLVGAVISGGLTLAYNKALTGDMWLTPFTKYSPHDRLGFGNDIGLEYWMPAARKHDLARADANFCINFNRLTESLLGWPTAALLIAALALAYRQRRRLVIALLLAVAALPIAYTFYLFDGTVFGPRYWSETMPAWFMLMAVGLVVARRPARAALRLLGGRMQAARASAVLITAGGLLTLAAITSYWPGRLEFYGHSLWQTDRMMDNAVRSAGVHNAVVFVKATPYHHSMVLADRYGNGFLFNTPTLDGDIVYARDLGEQNVRLMALYPGRRFYTVRPGILAASSLKEIGPPAAVPAASTQQAAHLAAEGESVTLALE